jgi:membrane-associated phospholipid phosphatase
MSMRTHLPRPGGAGPAVILTAGIVALAVATLLGAPTVALDAALSTAMHAREQPWLTTLVTAITDVGATSFIVPLSVVATATLLAFRHWHGALVLASSVIAAQVLVAVVKLLVGRSRPDANGAMTDAGGYSFPSGHAATSAALYGTLALIVLGAARNRLGRSAAICLAMVPLAVGTSRVYLGAHFATDVVAGWLTGALLIVAACHLAHLVAPVRALRPAAS